ncbi:lytic polysaccharide monooxygenase auxiliary activity family 9 protein [Aspergillus affinis]|uniref:lytic polysaccharide monooxygenase auxiliary activity family 9 protein n=1 Tax=Aspergillus affinis TaxID=1070780 RepID=UPI0022FEF6D9|nr:uncharacterized protein KD926_010345 [Aspergillus affinis]KAI9045022.1 hypothetical protein KD926_010345 [Aspergillus affinis]
MSIAKIAGVVLGSAALVAGHGYVSGAVVDGKYYGGYIVSSYAYSDSPPETIGWSTEATDLGFVDGSDYSNADIICHKSAKPGAISAEIAAGGKVELQWTEWPESHHGPVITYLANCNGDCSKVDKTSLEFFKIDQKGLVDGSEAPGTWASDELIKNNNSWTVTVPDSIAAGNYVLRHEIIGLHSAGNKDGAQNYPQCFNLKVTGGGSDKPTGTLGTKLYKDTDAGILVSIYSSLDSYKIPGPALYSGASSSSGSGSSGSASSSAAATTAAAASTQAAAGGAQTSTATAYQTSTAVASVTVTGSPAQQTKVQDAATTTAAAAATSTGSSDSSAPAPSGTSSASLTEYFNSLSADQFLSLLSETFSWLVTDKKHARDTSA